MQLSGRLRLTTLGDLLGKVLREKLTGTLELTEEKGFYAGRVHRLHVHLGHVVQVDTEQTVQRLGEMLAFAGWFDIRQLDTFVRAAQARSVPLGLWLVDTEIVPMSVMVEAVVAQIRLRLEALFQVEDARVTFRLVQVRRRELDAPRRLEPREYLVGRPRARDKSNDLLTGKSGSNQSTLERRRDLQILGLQPKANDAEIRSAFRRLARALHPDVHSGASPSQLQVIKQQFVEVSAAYHRLIDVAKLAG
jgi:DnaJ-domain-containing protein 1